MQITKNKKHYLALICIALLISLASIFGLSSKVFAADTAQDTSPKVTSATTEVTAYFTGTGSVVVPATEITNTSKYTITIVKALAPSGYDWSNDAQGKTIKPGETLSVNWTASETISSELAEQVITEGSLYIGDMTYLYSYEVPNITGDLELDKTSAYIGDTITATATNSNALNLSYQWYRVNGEDESLIEGATTNTYTVTADDKDCSLICKAFDSAGVLAGELISVKANVKSETAFAVYSADDGSLNFYKRNSVPATDSTFEDKKVTAVFSGVENTGSYIVWTEYASSIKTAEIVDDNIQPLSTSGWFAKLMNLTTINGLEKLDLSKTNNMSGMFNQCTSLKEVTLGDNWQWIGENGYLPTPSSTYIPSADGKWYAASNSTGYAPADIPAGKADTYYAVPPQAFAVYSADDNSLNFYNRAGMPSAGEQFNNKTTTNIYTDIESINVYDSSNSGYFPEKIPWYSVRSNVQTVNIADTGIKPISLAYWFNEFTNLRTISNLSRLNVGSVTSMRALFANCSSLTSISGLSSLNVQNVTDLSNCFYNCSSLTFSTNDLTAWKVTNVTDLHSTFANCTSLKTINLYGWGTLSKVADASWMFSGCTSLTTITGLNKWQMANADLRYMFQNCSSITALNLLNLTFYNSDNTKDMFSGMTKIQQVTFGNVIGSINNTNVGLPMLSSKSWYYYNHSSGTSTKMGSSFALVTQTTLYREGYNPTIQAYAIYSATDNSLSFYKRAYAPAVGTIFNGKVVTALCTGVEDDVSASGPYLSNVTWGNYMRLIKTAIVVDHTVTPINTGGWFMNATNLVSCDLRFNTSKTTAASTTGTSYTFSNCPKLARLYLGANWKCYVKGVLPTPTAANITGADGKWYISSTTGYTPATIPARAGIYYASKSLISSSSASTQALDTPPNEPIITDSEKAIVEENGSDVSTTPETNSDYINSSPPEESAIKPGEDEVENVSDTTKETTQDES